ncbi:hypothetical protein FGG78_28220, partial [Thioclava sp. BHET1]
MENKFLDPDHPFFRPVWRRWATAVLPILWAGFEAWQGFTIWAIGFGAAGVYAFWQLIMIGPTEPEDE